MQVPGKVAAPTRQWLSVTRTATYAFQVGTHSPFNETLGGTVVVNSSDGITFDKNTGVATLSAGGIYEVKAVLNLVQSANGLLDVFDIQVGGVTVWTASPFVHRNFDPLDRSINAMLEILAPTTIEILVRSANWALTASAGSNLIIKRYV